MYDTRLTYEDLSVESILERITEYDIYKYYIGDAFKLGRIMHSPLREDKNASFGIFKGRNGRLLYKDLATGSTGNCIQFVAELQKCSYRDAILIISKDLDSKALRITTCGININENYKNVKTVISIKKKNFTDTDDNYWGQFCLFRE